MAGPITHIILANKVFDKYFKGKNKKAFFIGTNFPDIRYLKVIEREKTHSRRLDIKEVKKEDSFIAGFKFHSIVDEVRERFMLPYEEEKFFPLSKRAVFAVKLFEDEMLYDETLDWKEHITHFDEILPQELNFSIDKEVIKKWHKILQDYLSQKPTNVNRKKFMQNIQIPKAITNEVLLVIEELNSNEKLKSVLSNFHTEFKKLLIQN